MKIVITISGLHGTGKSTYARVVARSFKLRHVSAGELFRQIAAERNCSIAELSLEAEKDIAVDCLLDDRTRQEIRKGDVVIDGLLASWIAKDTVALKIYLLAPYQTRIGRIASRDGVSYDEAERLTILREQIERRRFKRFYGIDIDDLSIYDLVFNTGLMSTDLNIGVIKSLVKRYIKSNRG